MYLASLVTVVLAVSTNGDLLSGPGKVDSNLLMIGTYEFEMMGRPHKLYVCDTDKMAEDKKAMYWAITDTTQNEYTIAVGRDVDGVYAEEDKFVARSGFIRLFGAEVLRGYYELIFDPTDVMYTLRERFAEFEEGQADTEVWNEYQMVKLSPAIVGNQELEGYQCFHPLGNEIIDMPIPMVSRSDYLEIDHGYISNVIYPGPTELDVTACWKLQNEFGDVLQAGYTYYFQLEWETSMLVARFDNFNSNRNLRGCKVGTQFIVMVAPDLAIVSMQCADRVTGRTFLSHVSEYVEEKEDLMCPFKLTAFDDSQFAEEGLHNDEFVDNLEWVPAPEVADTSVAPPTVTMETPETTNL